MEKAEIPFRDIFPLNLLVNRKQWEHIGIATKAMENGEEFYSYDKKCYPMNSQQAKALKRIWNKWSFSYWDIVVFAYYTLMYLILKDNYSILWGCVIALSGYLILVCYIYYPLLAALFCKRAEELRKQSKITL